MHIAFHDGVFDHGSRLFSALHNSWHNSTEDSSDVNVSYKYLPVCTYKYCIWCTGSWMAVCERLKTPFFLSISLLLAHIFISGTDTGVFLLARNVSE